MNNEAFKAFEDTAKRVNPSAMINLSRKHGLVSSVVRSHKDRHLEDGDSWSRLSEDDSLASGSTFESCYRQADGCGYPLSEWEIVNEDSDFTSSTISHETVNFSANHPATSLVENCFSTSSSMGVMPAPELVITTTCLGVGTKSKNDFSVSNTTITLKEHPSSKRNASAKELVGHGNEADLSMEQTCCIALDSSTNSSASMEETTPAPELKMSTQGTASERSLSVRDNCTIESSPISSTKLHSGSSSSIDRSHCTKKVEVEHCHVCSVSSLQETGLEIARTPQQNAEAERPALAHFHRVIGRFFRRSRLEDEL